MLCECKNWECFEQLKMTAKERFTYMRAGIKPIKTGHPIPDGARLIKGKNGIEFYRLGAADE